MKHIFPGVVICAVSIGSLLLHARSQAHHQGTTAPRQTSTKVKPQAQLEVDRMISTQQRLNKYFHSVVLPKLKPCWSTLRGSGTIEFKHSFKKNAGINWLADKVEIESSTIQEDQRPIALKCMQVATGGTSFSATDSERTVKDYVMYWTWPVPIPPNADELTQAMFRQRPVGGRYGCDGKGSRAKCWSCDGNADCKRTCTGSLDCAKGIDSCVAFGACSTGGAFSLGGGAVIQ